ncbi:MAG TPA: hypothetical protein VF432_16885 [Thermoanaerobaculia bacterium]
MRIRTVIAAGAALLLSGFLRPDPAFGGDRRRVLAVSAPSSGLELTFVSAPDGVVDAGTIQWRGGSRKATVTTRTVRLRIGQPAPEPRGTATVRAFLETADARCTVRVDGVVLTSVPRVIQRHAPVGLAVPHRIEIEVPVHAADGPLLASIGWEVSSE